MTDRMQTVQGRCPACGTTSLFVADGGYITCSLDTCPNPDAASQVLGEIAEARQHGAFTFCDQLVGHVSMTAFATKISEKRNALGQREEAVRHANEQQQRAGAAERHLRAVEFTARHWHQALIDNIPAAHAIACISAAIGGQIDPNQLGLDPSVHDAFRDALDQTKES